MKINLEELFGPPEPPKLKKPLESPPPLFPPVVSNTSFAVNSDINNTLTINADFFIMVDGYRIHPVVDNATGQVTWVAEEEKAP
jgi:hypothetical protein